MKLGRNGKKIDNGRAHSFLNEQNTIYYSWNRNEKKRYSKENNWKNGQTIIKLETYKDWEGANKIEMVERTY